MNETRASEEAARRKAQGQRAEELARRYLVSQGHRILEANVRVGRDEIDLVTVDRDDIVFVEVRSRRAGARVSPEAGFVASKRAALCRGASRLIGERGWGNRRCRFDLVTVRFAGEVARLRHYPGAFVDES